MHHDKDCRQATHQRSLLSPSGRAVVSPCLICLSLRTLCSPSKVVLQQHLFTPNPRSAQRLRYLTFPVSLQPIPRPHVITTEHAEQSVTHNTDAKDRTTEERNLADLWRCFSHSGNHAPRERLRAAPQKYSIFIYDAAVCERPVRIMTL
jgi:hypothetical protein